MYPKNVSDVEYPHEEKHRGTRLDGRNLVQAWQEAKPRGKVTGTLWGWGHTHQPTVTLQSHSWGMEYFGECLQGWQRQWRGDNACPLSPGC